MRSLALVAIGLALASAGIAVASEDAITSGHAALERRDVAAALEQVAQLDRRGDEGVDAMVLRALTYQFTGDHGAALEAIEAVPRGLGVEDLRSVIEAGARWMGDATELQSEHFVLRHAPGVDAIWAERALDILEAAHDHVGADLGLYPAEAVVVEVYPTSASFAEATGLPPEAVANDTVGLYRWDRLLVTSPMAAAFGYPWADTLCHEYTHLIVDRLGGGRVPVWLHEGIASFEQRRWRGGDDARVSPSGLRLLADALGAGDLVTLEEIGTCLACLESPERVQLGFVQMHTLVDHVVRSRGIDAIQRTLAACRLGADAEDALGTAWGEGFEDLWGSWRGAVEGQEVGAAEGAGVVGLALDEAGPGATVDDRVLAGQPRGAAHARLGDLLVARGQRRAALLEYDRAANHLDDISPALACKRAAVLRDLGLAGRALEEVEAARRLYPEFEPLLINAARAQMDLGQREQALLALDDAELINPFDPRIHAWRLELLDADRDAEAVRRAEGALEALEDHMFYDGTEPGMAR